MTCFNRVNAPNGDQNILRGLPETGSRGARPCPPAGGHEPPIFVRPVNPILTRGADNARHIANCPPDF